MSDLVYERLSYDISAAQDKEGLLLGSDACLLAAFVPKNAKRDICELGAGSGVISMMLLQRGKIRSSLCVDVLPKMCEIARENAQRNGLNDKMKVVCSDVLDFSPEIKYDAVVCNPPYFKAGDGKENASELDKIMRHETTATVDGFAVCASRCLKDGGCAYFCYTPGRLPDLYYAFKRAGLEPKTQILVYPTKDHKPSLALVSAKKGGKSGLDCARPLIIYKDAPGGEYSAEFEEIRKNCRTDILK